MTDEKECNICPINGKECNKHCAWLMFVPEDSNKTRQICAMRVIVSLLKIIVDKK